jgi:PAS domain S-box-containing protein
MTETIKQLKHYQMLINNVRDGIHVMDIQGDIVEVNDAFCEMLGYTREEASKLNIADWNSQYSKGELLARIKKFVGKNAIFDTVHRRKDGTLINVEVSLKGVDLEGQAYIFASSRDITERKHAEMTLLQHKAAIDTTHEGFWMTDEQGVILEANQAYAEMSGYSLEELRGMQVLQFEAKEQSLN